jgi:esterase
MKLHFKRYGTGPSLCILHGLFGSLNHWHSHARALSERFTVYVLDQRNHGGSPHDSVMTYDAMADDLREFMDDHSIPEVRLLGHSMGGKTAMRFAGLYRSRLHSLVVADIAARAYPPAHDDVFESLFTIDPSRYASREEIDRALEPLLPEYRVRHFLMTNLFRDGGGHYRWKMNVPVIHRNYRTIAGAVQVDPPYTGPALFVRGGRSHYLLPSDEPGIRLLFPQARFAVISGAGHWVHAEAPEVFRQLLLEFFDGPPDGVPDSPESQE